MEPFQSLGKYFCSSLLADRIDERCEVSYTCINSNMSPWLLLGNRGINRDVAFYQSSVSTTERAPVTAPPPKDPVYEALCRENQKVGPQEFSTDLASTPESRSLLIHIQSGATCTQDWTFRIRKPNVYYHRICMFDPILTHSRTNYKTLTKINWNDTFSKFNEETRLTSVLWFSLNLTNIPITLKIK